MREEQVKKWKEREAVIEKEQARSRRKKERKAKVLHKNSPVFI